jgi:hypothetical protein
MLEVSRPPGELVRWDDLKNGMKRLKEGAPVNYHGLTSPCDIDDLGQLQNGLFILRHWTVVDNEREPELYVSCRGQ